MTIATQQEPECSNVSSEVSPRPGYRPIRVAYLIDRLGIGGTETQLLALIQHLDRYKFEPFLILLNGEDTESRRLEPSDVPVLRLGVRSLRSFKALRQVRHLARFLRHEQIDILQMYFPDSTYFGVVAGKLGGVKTLIRTRNNVNHWMTPAHRVLGRLLNPWVSLTICNSEAGREAVLRDERPDPSRVVVIQNGVDLDRFAHIPPFDPAPSPGRMRRVGMVANLRHVKGVDLFIRAAARIVREHTDLEFVVAGEGDQRAELEQLITELGLTGRFHLPGRIDDIPGFLETLDIAVLSSRAEGTPNAVLEYMAAGRPIVATAVGGIETLISPEVNGVRVPPEDVDCLASSLIELLTNPERSARLGESARRFAIFSLARSRHAETLAQMYQSRY